MEALCIQLWEKDGVGIKEEEQGKRGEDVEGGLKASTPVGCTTDEETDEDSESEPPPVVRRKVSFADAFGLDLVSVKEFDNVEAPEPEVNLPSEMETMRPSDEFYMSCLFSVPSSPEELDQRLQEQMVELESIELLPGTTTIRGIVRVVNLSYWKSVYARMSLDRWATYFDLAAEYVPGSSDRKTDRFSFTYRLVPPFEREGTRVDICLRYDTSVGSFWANNKELNYVLFCHQKGHISEHGPHMQDESIGHRGKRSCLRVNRRGSAEEKTRETSNTSAVVADSRASDKAEEAKRKKTDRAEIQSVLGGKENKPLVDSIKSRHRAARLARVQNGLFQRRHHVPQAHSHDSARGQPCSESLPTPWGLLHKRQKPTNESLPVLTYHQIPLLTLDWNSDAAKQWGADHMDDIWTGRADMKEDNIEDKPSVNDIWEAFCNRADDSRDRETSVCDLWQAFLNEPSCVDHSAVPESEWLQTAASVSPSNDRDPKSRYTANSRDYDFQMGTDSPASSGASQPFSSSSVSLRSEVHQQAEACVSRPGDDNTTASQRSETNSVTDTLQEFSLEGATPPAEGPVDGSAECHKQAARQPESEGIIGGAEGTGEDEASITHTDDFVTSSGESETTDMTATPESKNASRDDRISQGAKQAEGFSSSREGQVTDGVHNATDDTLAFRGTIGQHTKDGETYAFSTSRRGAEEEVVNRCAEKKASTGEEIFRPQTPEECEISQRYADEKQCEEVRLNQNSKNPLQENKSDEGETRTAQSHADEFSANPTRDGNFKEGQIIASEFKLEESESKVVASNSEEFKKTEVEPSYCLTSEETKGLIGAEEEIIQVLNEEAVQVNSSWQKGNTSIIPEVHNEQMSPIQTEEELCVQEEEEEEEEEEHSKLTQIEENVELEPETGISNQTDEDKHLSCDGIMKERREINPSAQSRHRVDSKEMEEVIWKDQDSSGSFTVDKGNPNPVELAVMRRTRLQDDMKGQNEDVVGEISPENVTEKEGAAKTDTPAELQCQPERLEGTEEDMSQRDKDERVSIGELKIDAPGEMMGNAGIPRGETQNTPAQLKELSAEVESTHAHVERKELSEGTKAITGENTVALEVIETGLEEMLIQRFGEELVRGIWEEVFDLKARTPSGDTNVDDGIGEEFVDIPNITQNCHLLFEEDFSEAFDSGIFSLTETELPSDPNTSLSQGLEQINVAKSYEYSPKESNKPLTTTEESHFPSDPQTDAISSAPLSLGLTTVAPALSRQSFSEADQCFLQETGTQIKERSVTPPETARQTEEGAAAHRQSFNLPEPQCLKHQSPSSEELTQSSRLAWWSILYILSHITRLLIGAILVVGFYGFIFLCDFPVFPSTLCFVIMLVVLYVEETSRQDKQGGGRIV